MPQRTTPEMQNAPLTPEQETYKQFGLTHPKCGLWLDMGCGKTRITLEILFERNPNHHVLIIAPKTIARSVWTDEIKKWGLPFRTKSLIVNERGKKLIDEAQAFKGYRSERFKSLKKVQPAIQYLIELTGTPKPKGVEDLWPQIYLMDGGARLGVNITTFRNDFMYPTAVINGHPVGYQPIKGAEAEIYRRISDLVISGKNSSVKLPTLNMQTIYAHMTSDEMKIYKRLMKEYVFVSDDGEVVTADTAAILQMKLAQMSSGTLYTDAKKNQYAIIHTQKLDICKYIIDNTSTPCLIAYHFNSEKSELIKFFSDLHYDIKVFNKTPEMIADWNNGNIPIMLIAGEGGGDDWVVTGEQLQAIYDDIPDNKIMLRRKNTVHNEVLYAPDGSGRRVFTGKTETGGLNHDGTFKRVAGDSRKPEEMTLREVKKLSIDGEPVPTYEEMLISSRGRMVLFTELKGNTADIKMADDAIKLVKQYQMEDEVVLISLKYDLIDYIETNYPEMQTGFLTFASFGETAALNCDYIGLEEESATSDAIDAIHREGKKALVWTANEKGSQKHFLCTKIDGIITDNVTQAMDLTTELEHRSDLDRMIDKIKTII